MSTDHITLTDIDIERCESLANSYTKATLEAFGVEWPPIAGWKRALRGKIIKRADYERAMLGRSWKAHVVEQQKKQLNLF